MSNTFGNNATLEEGSGGEGDANPFVMFFRNFDTLGGLFGGKRKQGDDTGPTNLCCIELDDREDISPLSSPYYYSRKQANNDEDAASHTKALPVTNSARRFKSKKSKNLSGGYDSGLDPDELGLSEAPNLSWSSFIPIPTVSEHSQVTSGTEDDESSELEALALGVLVDSTADMPNDRVSKTPTPTRSDEFQSVAVTVTPPGQTKSSDARTEGSPPVRSNDKSRQGLFLDSTTSKTDRVPEKPSSLNMERIPQGSVRGTTGRETNASENPREDVEDALVLPTLQVVDNGKLAAMKRIMAAREQASPRSPPLRGHENSPRFSPSKDERIPVWHLADDDILGTRKSTGTNHVGTLAFQELIREFYDTYNSFGRQHGKKTKLTRRIRDFETTGRFVRKVGEDEYDLMTLEEARLKVSQGFRDERAHRLKMSNE